MDSKISVIIPVYKVEPYLRQCLDSVVNQTYRNLEIIIIDDGSPDNCGAICDEYAAKDPRIEVIHKQNGGLCAARNDGIQRATGDWITFVDSDDWCELDYYEQLLEGIEGIFPDIICAGGRILEFQNKKHIASTFLEKFQYTDRTQFDELMVGTMVSRHWKGEKYGSTFGTPWDKLYSRRFIQQTSLCFDVSSKAWEDLWFNFQVFDKVKLVVGNTYIGYHYRQVENSIVRGFSPQKPDINYDFISKLRKYMDQRGQNQDILRAIQARTINIINNALSCCYFHPANQQTYHEVAMQIKKMRQLPYFHEAIWSNQNHYLTKKQIVLKYALRLPWVWPLKLLYAANQRLKGES